MESNSKKSKIARSRNRVHLKVLMGLTLFRHRKLERLVLQATYIGIDSICRATINITRLANELKLWRSAPGLFMRKRVQTTPRRSKVIGLAGRIHVVILSDSPPLAA